MRKIGTYKNLKFNIYNEQDKIKEAQSNANKTFKDNPEGKEASLIQGNKAAIEVAKAKIIGDATGTNPFDSKAASFFEGVDIPSESTEFKDYDPKNKSEILNELPEENPTDTVDIRQNDPIIPNNSDLEFVNSDLNEQAIGNDDKILPVFLVLSYENNAIGSAINYVLNSKYSHISVAFDSSLKHIYSFSIKNSKNFLNKGGFVIDGIKNIKNNKGRIKVIALFVRLDQFNKLKDKIKFYINHSTETEYSTRTALNVLMGKEIFTVDGMHNVCSTFVNGLFSDVLGVKLIKNIKNSLITPKNISNSKNKKFYQVYEGDALGYNQLTVDSQLSNIITNNLYTLLKENISL